MEVLVKASPSNGQVSDGQSECRVQGVVASTKQVASAGVHVCKASQGAAFEPLVVQPVVKPEHRNVLLNNDRASMPVLRDVSKPTTTPSKLLRDVSNGCEATVLELQIDELNDKMPARSPATSKLVRID